MKFKKFLVGTVGILGVSALVGCGKADPNAIVDKDYSIANPGTL